ncbi:hypothetical protein GGD38_005749 [Chitinophagaceae bacterium OAS944]|nr:hypothetical protein [Chitinophagaceae bacterium OAS944]
MQSPDCVLGSFGSWCLDFGISAGRRFYLVLGFWNLKFPRQPQVGAGKDMLYKYPIQRSPDGNVGADIIII